jgi:hypothetical protein
VGDAELAEEDIVLEDGEESTLHGHLALESPDPVLGEPLQSRSPLLARAAAVFGYGVNGSSFAHARANVKQARGQMQRMSAADFEQCLRIMHKQQVMHASFSAMLSSDGFGMSALLLPVLVHMKGYAADLLSPILEKAERDEAISPVELFQASMGYNLLESLAIYVERQFTRKHFGDDIRRTWFRRFFVQLPRRRISGSTTVQPLLNWV